MGYAILRIYSYITNENLNIDILNLYNKYMKISYMTLTSCHITAKRKHESMVQLVFFVSNNRPGDILEVTYLEFN